ncbi:MAG: methionyl-tRNA synthetase [Planctomycetota bacterium]|jgi:methionyl-tRNA synthetase
MSRQILVTSALPYANGQIHLGHLVEYIQTDIFARFQRMRGHKVGFMCADDTHGTAIMIRAEKEGITPEKMIAEMSESHQRDFAAFGISFDHYGSTNSDANRAVGEDIWQKLLDQDLVVEKAVPRLFDNQKQMFLADRFVKGTCPKCQTPDQYGDACEKCGTAYSATELIDPKSVFTDTTPELKESQQFFVKLEPMQEMLTEWTQHSGALQSEVANYLLGYFLGKPLQDWDVSRPAPYFGFEIPNQPGNYWYVWFDAPCGYIASTVEWCAKTGDNADNWWRNENTEIVHFLGKDITYFHTLFWPAMLHAAGYNKPKRVHIHGFLQINGEKMSKSRGTFVNASRYLEFLDPDWLRYYYASKLSNKIDDLDFHSDEFVGKVNSDLVGRVVNLASRSAKFVATTGLSKNYPDDGGLFAKAADMSDTIAAAYESCDYREAMRLIMTLADAANEYVDQKTPWTLRKDPEKAQELQDVCTVVINLFHQIVVYLTPVLPALAKKTAALLGDDITSWSQASTPLVGRDIAKFQHMMTRVEAAKVEEMFTPEEVPPSSPTLAKEPLAAEITIDEFQKVDLRVAEILAANEVPEAHKLLQLTLGLGGDVTRNVFAGIKGAYEPDKLVGRLVVMVANLKPRKMKFGMSEGMVAAAGTDGEVYLLSPDSGAVPGQRLH